ncbi:hypothetical protein QTO34_006396 [Cnephaeus nilssonii]|uniref:Ras-GEF domain-containing protein n=1 Tax=Cnephaeus nilssonii TaxID=3371016 RepID=A0AA40LHF0_CNENI|nr:hypothetical protein QTO34_006396 [Eptesicus nilssonii]
MPRLLTPPGRDRALSFQKCNKDITEELDDRFIDAINGYKGQMCQARKSVQCQTESSKEDIVEELVNVFNYSTFLNPGKVHQATDTIQCAAELTLNLREVCRMRALQKGTLEKVAVSLVPAFPAGNIPHICTLMPIHPAFSRAQGATASVMGTWLDRVQYFGHPLLSSWFIMKQALVLHSLPTPHPVGLVKSFWVELEHLEPIEAQWEEPPPELKHTPEPEEGPVPGLQPGPAVVVLEPSGPPTLIQITTEPAPFPTTNYPRAATPKHLIRQVNLPSKTGVRATDSNGCELFKKLLPHQFLGSVWSQRAKPGKEHVASSVHATITQFNHVATCVITTCLGDPSMMSRIGPKWWSTGLRWPRWKQPSTCATLMLYHQESKKRLQKKAVSSPSLWPQEQKVMEKTVLLEVVVQKYKIESEEQFEAWFWALEQLIENDRAIASMVGTWLGQAQGFEQPLPSAWLQVEQALIPINSPASHLVGHAQNLWVELEHLVPTKATQEAEVCPVSCPIHQLSSAPDTQPRTEPPPSEDSSQDWSMSSKPHSHRRPIHSVHNSGRLLCQALSFSHEQKPDSKEEQANQPFIIRVTRFHGVNRGGKHLKRHLPGWPCRLGRLP